MEQTRKARCVVVGALIAGTLVAQVGCSRPPLPPSAAASQAATPPRTEPPPGPPAATPEPSPALHAGCEGARQAIDQALASNRPILMHDTFVLADCDSSSPLLARVRKLIGDKALTDGALEGAALREVLGARNPPLDPKALMPGCEGDSCIVDAFFVNTATVPKAPGGGVWSLIVCHSFVDGHSDISRKGLRGKLSADAVELVADASQDPDFYFWNTPCAHAQSRSDDRTGELVDPDHGITSFLHWERATLQRMIAACGAGEPRPALYWLGYAVHGLQDLVFHAGISNAEHSYLDGVKNVGIDCKKDFTAKRDLAVEATDRFAGLLAKRYPACWAAMSGWHAKPDESPGYTKDRKVAIVGHDWDLNPFPYKKLAAKVKARLAADPTYEKRTMLQKHWLESLTSPSLDEWFEKDLWPAVEPGKAGSGAGPLLGLDCSAG